MHHLKPFSKQILALAEGSRFDPVKRGLNIDPVQKPNKFIALKFKYSFAGPKIINSFLDKSGVLLKAPFQSPKSWYPATHFKKEVGFDEELFLTPHFAFVNLGWSLQHFGTVTCDYWCFFWFKDCCVQQNSVSILLGKREGVDEEEIVAAAGIWQGCEILFHNFVEWICKRVCA